MKFTKRACQACGNSTAETIYTNNLALLDGLDMSYTLSRCKQCGFHFANYLPSENQYSEYYSRLSKYDSQPHVSTLDQYRADAAVDIFKKRFGRDIAILDIGCGSGVFLAALRDAGFHNLNGIDPAPQSSNRALELFGLKNIHQGSLQNAIDLVDFSGVDLVCLMAVLEHLPELRRDLKKLLTQLRKGAMLMVEVPALDLFDANRSEPFGELSIEHIQYFQVSSLHNMFASLGAKVVETALLELGDINSGALFALIEIEENVSPIINHEDPSVMDTYLTKSELRWLEALENVPTTSFILYGAGSHSARLLPRLNSQQKLNLMAVIDGNTNLHGKKIGDWLVEPPEALSKYPNIPVLISSWRSENIIAQNLKQDFPDHVLKLMYENVSRV